MAAPLLSYENLGLIQGSGWLFRGLNIFVGERDRLALIGRNGAGKTTLLKLIAGRIEADEGKRSIVPGTNVVMLKQDPDLAPFATLRDFTLAGQSPPALHEIEAIADQIGIDLSARRPPHRAASGAGRRSAGRWPASRTFCSSTSRPTIWTSPRSTGWKAGSRDTAAPSSRSAMTGPSSRA